MAGKFLALSSHGSELFVLQRQGLKAEMSHRIRMLHCFSPMYRLGDPGAVWGWLQCVSPALPAQRMGQPGVSAARTQALGLCDSLLQPLVEISRGGLLQLWKCSERGSRRQNCTWHSHSAATAALGQFQLPETEHEPSCGEFGCLFGSFLCLAFFPVKPERCANPLIRVPFH